MSFRVRALPTPMRHVSGAFERARMKHFVKKLLGPAIVNRWRMRGQRQDRSIETIFTDYYSTNFWGDADSRSGPGSSDGETVRAREILPGLMRELKVQSFLDVPCGDFHWMAQVDLGEVAYFGGDIVAEMISDNADCYGGPHRTFFQCDLTRDRLMRADLVLCRDCLFHLSFPDARAAIANIAASGSTYLLTTTHPNTTENRPVMTGGYRPLNLSRPPFDFPEPMRLIYERENAEFGDTDKALGLWSIADLTA